MSQYYFSFCIFSVWEKDLVFQMMREIRGEFPGMVRYSFWRFESSLVAQMVKNLPAMQDTQVQSLGREDALEKGLATHSRILAWRIPWTEEPGGLQSMGLQRVRHDWGTNSTDVPVNENIGTWLEVAMEHRKPWTWLVTWAYCIFRISSVWQKYNISRICNLKFSNSHIKKCLNR